MSMVPPIRLLICEDQRLMRESLRIVLSLEPGFEVIGEAGDGAEAIRLAYQYQPDIVLMDIMMPQVNGVAATATITTQLPTVRVIILTTFSADDYVFEAIEAGAMGYLLKDVPATELVSTIRRVYAGEAFIQPAIATKLLMVYGRQGQLTPPHSPVPAQPEAITEKLSERELDVLKLLAQGASNRDIADHLVLAEGTIKNYVSNILLKLHAANRTHAATLARERGLI